MNPQPLVYTKRERLQAPLLNAPCTTGRTVAATVAYMGTGPMDRRARVAARLRELMDEHKPPLSLSGLDRETGGRLSKSRLGNYLQGTRMIGPEEAIILANVFGVTAAHVLCLDEDVPVLTPLERKLIDDFRTLPENLRNDYARRLSLLAMAHRDPLPDERLQATAYARRPKKPVK